jgi:transcriptional regulator
MTQEAREVTEHSYTQRLITAFVQVKVRLMVNQGEDLEAILDHLQTFDPVMVEEIYQATIDQTAPEAA